MEKKEEEKGQKDIETKMKELLDSLPNVSLNMDERQELKFIFERNLPVEEENALVAKFIERLKKRVEEDKNYRGKREIERLAPLYDTHDFWES